MLQCSEGIQAHHGHLDLALLLGSVPRCPRPTQGCSAFTAGLCTPSLTTSQSVTKDGVQGGSACFCFFVCLPFLIQAKQTWWKSRKNPKNILNIWQSHVHGPKHQTWSLILFSLFKIGSNISKPSCLYLPKCRDNRHAPPWPVYAFAEIGPQAPRTPSKCSIRYSEYRAFVTICYDAVGWPLVLNRISIYGASFLWFQVSQFAEKPAEHTQVYLASYQLLLEGIWLYVNLYDDGSATSNFKCLSGPSRAGNTQTWNSPSWVNWDLTNSTVFPLC